jgi:hypothetical protein
MNKRHHNEQNTNTDALPDEGLAGLAQPRERTRALNQAMIQELLTGRTRSV